MHILSLFIWTVGDLIGGALLCLFLLILAVGKLEDWRRK